jgi:two-component system, OmpR family, sensor histidine kinase KdpD
VGAFLDNLLTSAWISLRVMNDRAWAGPAEDGGAPAAPSSGVPLSVALRNLDCSPDELPGGAEPGAEPQVAAAQVPPEPVVQPRPAPAPAAPPPERERLLVAVAADEDPSHAEQLVRAGKRFAAALDADWTVVSVETPSSLGKGGRERDSRVEMFRLAESLGAETVTLDAQTAAEALAAYAKLRDTRTILVGAGRRAGGFSLFRRATVAALLRQCADANVIVIGRDRHVAPSDEDTLDSSRILNRAHWAGYAGSLGITALCTLIAFPLIDHVDLIDVVMIYMLGATLAALRLGRGPTVVNALGNVAAFDYFFVPPRFSFYVSDPQYLVTFGVMLAVAVIIANLVSAVRRQSVAAAARERRTATLYALSRELAVARDSDRMAQVAVRHVAELMHGIAAVFLIDAAGELYQPQGAVHPPSKWKPDPAICRWVVQHRQRAGLGAENRASERAIYLPLTGSQEAIGVLAVRPAEPRRTLLPEVLRPLELLAGTLALALERVRLAELAAAARVAAERAGLRNTLLTSISHDLRTPLSVIAGAGSMMAHEGFALDAHRRKTLGRLIEDKARDMTDLLTNVLELVRLETGPRALKCEWHSVEDLIGQALRQNDWRLGAWEVKFVLPPELPMLYVEGNLIVQMFSNLIENCTKYTPSGTQITIAARTEGNSVIVSVEDDGPGFGPGDPERLFDKFERGRAESNIGGAGLGLAICRAVARLHSGEIHALPARSGGARFEITLPVGSQPPAREEPRAP